MRYLEKLFLCEKLRKKDFIWNVGRYLNSYQSLVIGYERICHLDCYCCERSNSYIPRKLEQLGMTLISQYLKLEMTNPQYLKHDYSSEVRNHNNKIYRNNNTLK